MLSTLIQRIIYKLICQFNHTVISDNEPEGTRAGETIYTFGIKIHFGNQRFGMGKADQLHDDDPLLNTHLKWIYLIFTNQLPLPSNIIFDNPIGDQFDPIEGI